MKNIILKSQAGKVVARLILDRDASAGEFLEALRHGELSVELEPRHADRSSDVPTAAVKPPPRRPL